MNISEQNYLHNLDGKIGLAGVPSDFVDLVLTDPPYGIADGAKLTKTKGQIVSTKQAWGNDFQDRWEHIGSYYQWLKPLLGTKHTPKTKIQKI
ncbi:site-specific DNA-methyltransferase [Paracidovorax konjaci]|uniref:DNA methylase n=1 Tax=Paracidovorax konjaci TaxID=32040 RepID=A0A1I1T1X7_9BURK|nr:site-specific DNA-methyltransferase [Paracidovorax konjaci]SFD52694.1 hypothetical protein SAMN04489710_10373 [Paracidovorax konjaci]